MGRGQYDRAAAKAKRDDAMLSHMADVHLPPAKEFATLDADAKFYTFAGSKLIASVTPLVNGYGQPVSQADYDALVTKYDRLLRLCQTHGLMIDG